MNQTQRQYVCKRIDEITNSKINSLTDHRQVLLKDPTFGEIKETLVGRVPVEDLEFNFYRTDYNSVGQPLTVVCRANIRGATKDTLEQLVLSKHPPRDTTISYKIKNIEADASKLKDEVMLGNDAMNFSVMLAEFEAKEF